VETGGIRGRRGGKERGKKEEKTVEEKKQMGGRPIQIFQIVPIVFVIGEV